MRTVKEILETLKNDTSEKEYINSENEIVVISTEKNRCGKYILCFDGSVKNYETNKLLIKNTFPEIVKLRLLYNTIFRKYFGDEYNMCVLIDENKGYTLDNLIPVYGECIQFKKNGPCISTTDKLIFAVARNVERFFSFIHSGDIWKKFKTKDKVIHNNYYLREYKGTIDDYSPITKSMYEKTYNEVVEDNGVEQETIVTNEVSFKEEEVKEIKVEQQEKNVPKDITDEDYNAFMVGTFSVLKDHFSENLNSYVKLKIDKEKRILENKIESLEKECKDLEKKRSALAVSLEKMTNEFETKINDITKLYESSINKASEMTDKRPVEKQVFEAKFYLGFVFDIFNQIHHEILNNKTFTNEQKIEIVDYGMNILLQGGNLDKVYTELTKKKRATISYNDINSIK